MTLKERIGSWLKLRPEYGFSFYICDFFFRKILRQNKGVTWPIHYTSTIRCPEKLILGEGVFPGDSPGNYINAMNGIEIGDYTNLGPNVGLISSNHDFNQNEKVVFAPPIVIGKNCWIGMGAVVLPGVRLGDNTIVGAGAIVTKSFEEGYCVLAGNPASIIKRIEQNQSEKLVDP